MSLKKDPEKNKFLLKKITLGTALIVLGAINPGLAVAWQLTLSLFQSSIDLRKERAIEWVTTIQQHTETFKGKKFETDEFRDAFVYAFEQFMSLRSAEKRLGAEKIFLDFASSDNFQDYPLERYLDTLQKISPSGLAFLGFLKFKIIPLKEKGVKKKLEKNNLGGERSKEWWYQNYFEKEKLSSYFQQWLHDEFNPNSDKVKKKYNNGQEIKPPMLQKVFDIEEEQRKKYALPISELKYLGLLEQSISGGGIGSFVGSAWDFSDFAKDFIRFISDTSDS